MILATGLLEAIKDFIESNENTLGNTEEDRAFGEPLLGFARGDDPIFNDYKQHVDPAHWTPLEAFRRAYPDSRPASADLTVVSWVLPQTEKTKRENGRETFHPSESWIRARIFGEQVNESLRRCVVKFFHEAGVQALAPVLLPEWSRLESEKYVWASKWSERHMAYAAGLGTFGLCDGLITPKGKAIRVGSVLAHTSDLSVTPRPYEDHHAYCLYYSTGKCCTCAERCPVNAITENGHDKVKCRNHVHETCKQYVKETFGFEGYACGLCQTAVPCESRIPVRQKADRVE